MSDRMDVDWTITHDPYENRPLSRPVEFRVSLMENGIVLQGFINGCEVAGVVLEVAYPDGLESVVDEEQLPTALIGYLWRKQDLGHDPAAKVTLCDLNDEPCDGEE
jgi:hypothetical protein